MFSSRGRKIKELEKRVTDLEYENEIILRELLRVKERSYETFPIPAPPPPRWPYVSKWDRDRGLDWWFNQPTATNGPPKDSNADDAREMGLG